MKKAFCSYCGTELVKVVVPAEKICLENRLYGGTYNPFNKYDPVTGIRQYATYYRCPKRNWFFRHDVFDEQAELVKIKLTSGGWFNGRQFYKGKFGKPGEVIKKYA